MRVFEVITSLFRKDNDREGHKASNINSDWKIMKWGKDKWV